MVGLNTNPGPISTDVLYDQANHRSTLIWDSGRGDPNLVRTYNHNWRGASDPRITNHIITAGFWGIYCIEYTTVDRGLISALLDRWRHETHTFHFCSGDLGLSLQDVEIMLGLKVDGRPVIRSEIGETKEVRMQRVEYLLGRRPGPDDVDKSALHVTLDWLKDNFSQLPVDANEYTVMCFTRAAILLLLSSQFFSDKHGHIVALWPLPFLEDLEECAEYSWGSALLAWLEADMCDLVVRKNTGVSGALTFLQWWAYTRIRAISPIAGLPADFSFGDLYPRPSLGARWARLACDSPYVVDHNVFHIRDQFDQLSPEHVNQMQQLLHMLDKNHYTYYYDINQETDTLQNLFFASPDSMNLFRAFPDVMLMDCTYRTNRFNMPFLEVVGMTSTQQTFCVGFVFMRTETTENYIWALQQLRVSLVGCILPRVIVTDRDMALMNALEVVFPDSHHLLCTFHIAKNILANCRTIIPTDDWQNFLDKWHELVESETVSKYNDNLNKLADSYSEYPNVLEYLGNLLREYGHKFVACHTSYTMHLGNRTSNRVEGQHSSLKKYLATNSGNLESVWSNVDKILKKQFNVIKREIERCKSYFPHAFNIPLFIYLRSSISHQALEDILEEQKRCNGQFGGECDCGIKLSHGLPCHHELSMHMALGQPISLESIQKFWTKLDVQDELESNDDDGVDGAINEFRTVYSTKNPSEKYRMKKQLLDITVPSRTSMHEPELRKTKGRPKKGDNSTRRDKSAWEHIEEQVTQQSSNGRNKGKQKVEENPIPPRRSTLRPELETPTSRTFLYSEQIWNKLHPYINTVKDVVGDGNCGFRVIARVVGKQWGVDDWFEVRKDLQIELLTHKDTFFYLFEEACKGYDWMVDSFSWSDGTQMPPKDQWMHFPMCGYLIASCYNIPVVHLTMVCNGSATFLPAYSAPVMERNVPTVMVFVDGNHFVEIVPKQGVFPMPGIAPRWRNICNEEGLQWESLFRQNFQLYKALVRQEKKSKRIDASYDNPCIVPDDE